MGSNPAYYMRLRRSGAPANTVLPVLSNDVRYGSSPAVTPGTWTGSPSLTYTLKRDGVGITGLIGVSEATIEAYAYVAADIGASITLDEIDSVSATTATSVARTYLDATHLPNTAIWHSGAGLTLADTNTTIDVWTSTRGGKTGFAVTAPASGNRASYQATAGPGSRPVGRTDGSNDYWQGTLTSFLGSSWAAFALDWVGKLAGAETNGDILMRLTSGAQLITLGVSTTPAARPTASGTGGATSLGTTNLSTTHRRVAYVWDGSTQTLLVGGSSEDSDAMTHAAYSEALTLSVGAAGGVAATAADVVAFAVTAASATGSPLTTQQRNELNSLLAYLTGV